MSNALPSVTFRDGQSVPALGLGTWHMGERSSEKAGEIRALQAGIGCGMTLIDTAEMYANGGAEEVAGEAIRGRRDEVFLVSKVLPSNASRHGTIAACEASLKRLGTDHIDLYLLHWPGRHPLDGTIQAFEELRSSGKIGRWGVSNFDTLAMRQLAALPHGGDCASNQVLYNLSTRGIEFDLLAFLLSRDNVIAIPKSSSPERVAENRAAADISLTGEQLAELDQIFPPPRSREPLQMI